MTLFHTRYTNIQTNNPYLMGAIGFHCNRKTENQKTKRVFVGAQLSNEPIGEESFFPTTP